MELIRSGKEMKPIDPSPPTAKGGEDTPCENCAQKRSVGTTNANLYAPFCTAVMSVTTPLAIGGVSDEYGEQKTCAHPGQDRRVGKG